MLAPNSMSCERMALYCCSIIIYARNDFMSNDYYVIRLYTK